MFGTEKTTMSLKAGAEEMLEIPIVRVENTKFHFYPISYKAIDYRFKNTTNYPVQLRIWLDDTMLYGEIRSNVPLNEKYKVVEEDHHYAKEDEIFYRNSKVYKLVIDKETKKEIKKELILNNHSKVMYDYDLIPKDEIRGS